MTFVHHSVEPEEAVSDVPMDHAARVEWLKEIQRQLAAKPNTMSGPDLACHACGKNVTVRQGRNSGRWIAHHPRGNCRHDDALWTCDAADREAALGAFRDGMNL